MSPDDAKLRFAFNPKIAKELTYDERDKPGVQRRLKTLKRELQNGKGAHSRSATSQPKGRQTKYSSNGRSQGWHPRSSAFAPQ